MHRPLSHRMFHDPTWRIRWAVLSVGLALGVGWAALMPADIAPALSSNDKLNHLLAFACLAASGRLALRSGWRATSIVGAGLVAYGGFIELAQTQVPGRMGDWADLLADGAGVVLGLVLVLALRQGSRGKTR